MRKPDSLSAIIILALIGFDVFVWQQILFVHPTSHTELYFLDVGQGDSELLVLPGNVKILTDAGPDRTISRSLGKALSPSDRYIDLAIITHPQLDHFNGFNDLLHRYQFGAFLFNGRDESLESAEWRALLEKIEERNIPLIVLVAGDRVLYRDNRIRFLSPDNLWIQSAELNDTSLVEMVETPDFTALLTADIGFNVEEYLAKNFAVQADILKVGHHGSKYSSGKGFLLAVDPKLAVIEVGDNRYGHPTEEALQRLATLTAAKIFRTDKNGTIKVIAEYNKLKVFTER